MPDSKFFVYLECIDFLLLYKLNDFNDLLFFGVPLLKT